MHWCLDCLPTTTTTTCIQFYWSLNQIKPKITSEITSELWYCRPVKIKIHLSFRAGLCGTVSLTRWICHIYIYIYNIAVYVWTPPQNITIPYSSTQPLCTNCTQCVTGINQLLTLPHNNQRRRERWRSIRRWTSWPYGSERLGQTRSLSASLARECWCSRQWVEGRGDRI